MNVEKVIKGLECRSTNLPNRDCENCRYGMTMGRRWGCDFMRLCGDALTLLKAQEPIEPTKPDEDNMVYCGACGTPVGYEVLEPHGMDYIRYNYCPNCGRNVRWE